MERHPARAARRSILFALFSMSFLCVPFAGCKENTQENTQNNTQQSADTESADTESADTESADTESADTNATTQDTDQTSDTNTATDANTEDLSDTPLVIPSACDTLSPEALVACVSQTRYREDLTFIAQPRSPQTAHWQATQDLCAQVLTDAGFTVERHTYTSGVNVIGLRIGQTIPNEWVMISAHYDSVEGCAGADDNGSGVAGALEAARVLSTASFERTLVVACWDEEELGLVGSMAYANQLGNPPLIVAHYVLEMIGYASDEPNSQEIPFGFDLLFPKAVEQVAANDNRGDFLAVIHDVQSRASAQQLVRYAQALNLPLVTLAVADALKNEDIAADLRRSDHAAFWLHDLPAMMLTDTANFRNPHYHCAGGEDALATIHFDFATKNVQAIVGAAATDLILH